MLNSSNLPQWVSALFSEKFFNACVTHENEKKNEKNVYCLDCCESICFHCFSDHQSHRFLQIRRYVYNDVLKVCDAQKLIDCSSVQSYTSNRKKVVFIKQRPQTRPYKSSTSFCTFCDRALQTPFLFCCLSCKLNSILRTEGRITKNHMSEFEGLSFPEPNSEDENLMTPDSVLEPAGSNRTESGSSWNRCMLTCTATSAMTRKKRRGSPAQCRPISSPAVEIIGGGRRKNTPHRSPLY